MGEQWGLSVKLFGKTILVVPTSKGADSAQVTSDELLKDAELTSPLARCTETEEEIAGKSESESPDLETGILRGGGENGTDDEDVEEFLQLPQQEVNGSEDGDEEAQKKDAAVAETTESNDDEKEENDDDKKKTTTTVGDKKKAAVAEKPDKNKVLPCPRCKSEDTKFCYYNNYNVNQPRHFCRNCQRYWTAGGTMRNVPVGAGRRKSKSIVAADANNALYVFMLRHLQQQQLQNGYITTEAAALHQPSMHTNKASTVLSFSPDAPVAGVTTLGHVNFHSQTAPGMVLVYSPPAGGDSTPPPTRTASVPTNQTFPSCFNNFTKDQKPGQQLYYHNQGTMNVPHPPPNRTCASKYEPWLPSPTSPADLVPLRQRPMHLGKHMRDDENNVNGDVKQRRHEEEEKRSIWVPKALRITDTPDAAASSSIWTTISASGLGFNKKDQNHCGKMAPSAAMERGFFNAFDTKEKQVAPSTTRTINNRDALLSVNPAAVARSHQFQETA